jgi:S1-C subfamily serine protease
MEQTPGRSNAVPNPIGHARAPLLASLCFLAFAAGCQTALEPSAAERHASFRTQQNAFTGDTVRAILQTCLVIGTGTGSAAPELDPGSGSVSLPHAPEGAYSQGLAVGVDPGGYLLTAGHVLREKNYVIGWIDGRLQIRRARVVFRGGPAGSGADFAVVSIDGKLDYVARYGRAPGRNDPVFAVVCNRGGSGVGGQLDLAGGAVLEGGADSHGRVDPVITTDIPLWFGDSGGPLLSGAGEFVGVNSAMEFSIFAGSRVFGGYKRLSFYPEEALIRRIVSEDRLKGPAQPDSPPTPPLGR